VPHRLSRAQPPMASDLNVLIDRMALLCDLLPRKGMSQADQAHSLERATLQYPALRHSIAPRAHRHRLRAYTHKQEAAVPLGTTARDEVDDARFDNVRHTPSKFDR
jgi:hypothetical protein